MVGAIQRPITVNWGDPATRSVSPRGPVGRWLSTTKPEGSYRSGPQHTNTEVVVYVRLLGEGTDVWRPARATALPDGTFRLLVSESESE
jgi:hypothetical protein